MLIVDTGVLVAAADRNDPDYHACSDLLETDEGPLVTTALVIAEACSSDSPDCLSRPRPSPF